MAYAVTYLTSFLAFINQIDFKQNNRRIHWVIKMSGFDDDRIPHSHGHTLLTKVHSIPTGTTRQPTTRRWRVWYFPTTTIRKTNTKRSTFQCSTRQPWRWIWWTSQHPRTSIASHDVLTIFSSWVQRNKQDKKNSGKLKRKECRHYRTR